MAILVFSPNGTYVTKPTLEAARTSADCAGKTIVVTSALTPAQSNITAAWPADRALEVKKGGSIANTFTFTVNGEFSAGPHQAFTGTGISVLSNVDKHYPEWYSSGTYTQVTIEAALSAIGLPNIVGGIVTNRVTLLLRPGTWEISSNADWSAYTNVTFRITPGAVISHGAFTVNIPNLDAGIHQVFDGTGLVTLSGIESVYPDWFKTNAIPGTTDMSVALQAAVLSGTKVIKIIGTMAAHEVAISTNHGVIFLGAGAGRWRATDAKSRLIFNGVAGEFIITVTDSVGLKFRDLLIDGNNRTGGGVWLMNRVGTAEINFNQYENVNFFQCTNGIKIGGNAGDIANFTQVNGNNVAFFYCDCPVGIYNVNTEEMLFKNSFFIESYQYHFYATVGASLALEHVYLGNMNVAAVAAVCGPITLQWNDVWSEIGAHLVADIYDNGGPQASNMVSCHFTDSGLSGVTISWKAGSPLVLVDTYMGGRITYDSRKSNVSIVQQGLVFKPAPVGLTTTVGISAAPHIGGTYTGSTATFTVEIVDSGTVGTATFKWKKAAGLFSSAILTSKQTSIGEGLLIQFMPAEAYTAGDQWTFVAEPCGIVELNGYFVGDRYETKSFHMSSPDGVAWTTVAKLKASTADACYGGWCEVVVGGYAANIGSFSGVLGFRYDKLNGAFGYTITVVTNSITANMSLQAVNGGDNLSILIQVDNILAGNGYWYGDVVIRNTHATENVTPGVTKFGISIVEP